MNENLTGVCKIGQGAECCKYLVGSPFGFECAKYEGFKDIVDKSWNDTKTAQGDNCDGLPQRDLNNN